MNIERDNNFTTILMSVIGFIVFAGLAVSLVMLLMKFLKGEAYQLSLEELKKSPLVADYYGEPLRPSWYILGKVNLNGDGGFAAIEYKVEGPLSSGTVYVYATRSAGEWDLSKVMVASQSDGYEISVVDEEIPATLSQ
ncbi:MAG: cytochrome c oxidase assembly factor Coa1 family protein [Pseudomonadota bacterium]|nr:cytochrome c oxidase assembly factor Coa1 family protein [Pseudomonadota bacterium]MEC8102732.1 cytochrome c oxidase assembly factor Coa1 family protein [Pseudomonadota bacterium]